MLPLTLIDFQIINVTLIFKNIIDQKYLIT